MTVKIFKKICPICVLISLVWLTQLILKWFGYQVNADLLAMLMGGSAVGLSYVLAGRLSERVMIWKLISIPVGLAAMYALLRFAWIYFLIAVMVYCLIWLGFRSLGRKIATRSKSNLDINKELKNCC